MSAPHLFGHPIKAVLGIIVPIAFLWAAPGIAAAAETHVFDATLSLTGDCTTELVDPVPDPGLCPMPPGVPGVDHPPLRFSSPASVALDEFGDIYVASFGPAAGGGPEARIDFFTPQGGYIGGFADAGARDIAVDSEGHLYVHSQRSPVAVVQRFDPTEYNPAEGKIKYEDPPAVILEGAELEALVNGIAVNPSTGHLYVVFVHHISEYGSATEANPPISETIGEGVLNKAGYVAVDGSTGKIYASDDSTSQEGSPDIIRVFSGSAGHPLEAISYDGSCTAAGKFKSHDGLLSVAIEEETGHVFVDDREAGTAVYEFAESPGEEEECVSETKHSFQYVNTSSIAISNGAASANRGYLFVPSSQTTQGHVFAFKPKHEAPPTIESESAANVTEDEAQIEAKIDPGNIPTEYLFQIATQEAFETEAGFAGAATIGEGEIPGGNEGVVVSASAAELKPGTTYHVRAFAENAVGSDEEEVVFSTFGEPSPSASCANQALRVGLSAALPDCRAYELVSPPNTGGRAPYAAGTNLAGPPFGSPPVSPDGERASFLIYGGVIPGTEGAGAPNGDAYTAVRDGETGWHTHEAGPSGAQSSNPIPGGFSSDQSYASTIASEEGSLVVGDLETRYLRYPDGSFQLVGRGSLGTDPTATARTLSDGGAHIIFETTDFGSNLAVQLEPNAPPTGTETIYDRTIDPVSGEEETHVVSLLPGNVTPAAGQNAFFEGASPDGRGVAFTIGSTLFERLDDAETFEVATGATFAGISEAGTRVFYLKGGDLFAFQAEGEETIPFSSSGDVTPVNISPDGLRAYFVSSSDLTGSEENSQGKAAIAPAKGTGTLAAGSQQVAALSTSEGAFAVGMDIGGTGIPAETTITAVGAGTLTLSRKATVSGAEELSATSQNLYLSDGSTTRFVAAVNERDVNGRFSGPGGFQLEGLGLWVSLLRQRELAPDPSRASADGNVFVFESRARLTGYDSGGKAEVYRYDAAGGELSCLSCNPTNVAASGDASLQSLLTTAGAAQPTGKFSLIPNSNSNGSRVIFQSPDALVPNDVDGVQDVYEWEENGVGSCARPSGCLSLISGGHSARPNYLYGVSASGGDVFFSTSDLLLGADTDETPSIYDARVDGGFASPSSGSCEGEACRPNLSSPPPLPSPGSSATGPSGNLSHGCPKGKHRVKKNGKSRCVKSHSKKHHKKGNAK